MGPPMSPATSDESPMPSRTARALRPSVILTTVLTMLICGVMGMGIGIARFSEDRTEPLPVSVGACQAFMIMASGSSILYALIHFACAIYNEPIGPMRPPEERLHAACFIVVRVSLLLWVVCVITTAVVIARPGICAGTNQECTLQVLDLIAANLCFLGTGVIITALDACKYPFEIPEAFTGVTCRVSSFGDDLYDRNMSAITSFDSLPARQREESMVAEEPVVKEYSTEAPALPGQAVIGGCPPEHGPTQLLPPIQSQAGAWSAEVKNLVAQEVFEREKSQKAVLVVGAGSKAPGGRSRNKHPRSRPRAPRTGYRRNAVTPTSSIGTETRRSSLSRMRSAEFPNIIVQPELKILSPRVQEPSRGVRPASRIAVRPPFPPPNGDLQRKKENVKPIIDSALPRMPGTYINSDDTTTSRSPPLPTIRRTSLEIQIPGAFIDSCSSIDDGNRKAEEHARSIEAEIAIRKQNYRLPKENVKVNRVHVRVQSSDSDSPRQRYKDRRKAKDRAKVATREESVEQETEEEIDMHGRRLRRITLADDGPVPGKVFDPSILRRYQ